MEIRSENEFYPCSSFFAPTAKRVNWTPQLRCPIAGTRFEATHLPVTQSMKVALALDWHAGQRGWQRGKRVAATGKIVA
jgi:hypothetical protein